MTLDELIRLLAREIVDELNSNQLALAVRGYGLNAHAQVTTKGEELIAEVIDRVLKDEQRRAA